MDGNLSDRAIRSAIQPSYAKAFLTTDNGETD